MRFPSGIGWRSVTVPVITALIVAALIRGVVPVHRHGTGALGALSIVLAVVIVVAAGFGALAWDQARAARPRAAKVKSPEALPAGSLAWDRLSIGYRRGGLEDEPTKHALGSEAVSVATLTGFVIITAGSSASVWIQTIPAQPAISDADVTAAPTLVLGLT